MKNRNLVMLAMLAIVIGLIAGCNKIPDVSPTNDMVITNTAVPQSTSASTAAAIDSQVLLEAAMDNFLTASSFQMKTHEVTSYQAIIADGTVRAIYGEFNATYDFHRSPEIKVRVQSEYRYSPDSDFFSEEYYLFERAAVSYSLTFSEDGLITVEETGGQSVEMLIGDTYQAISQFGMNAQFSHQDGDEMVYILEPPNWYSLSGAVQFADLGLLLAGPDGEAMVKEYAEENYPNVQPSRFIVHISIDDQVITAIEMENKDFMLSFWGAYDEALIEQGADPTQLTEYEIQPEHGAEIGFSDYNQAPDFEIPE